MKQIPTWEDMANLMTTLTGFTVLVGIFLAIYRNLTASLFDKLFMGGTDRTVIRFGKMFIDTISIFIIIFLFNVLPYFLCDIFLTKIDDINAELTRKIFNDLLQMMGMRFGLILPVIFLSYTVVFDSKLNSFLKRGGFFKLVIILFPLLIICLPSFQIVFEIVKSRWIDNSPIVFAIIGFILHMIMVLLDVALYIFPWKNITDVFKKWLLRVLSVSLVLYFLDIIHMAFFAKKPEVCIKYWVNLISIILITVMLSAVTVKVINENIVVDSLTETKSINFRGDPAISEKAENTIGLIVFFSVLLILGPILFKIIGFHLAEHNPKDVLMILRIFAEQIWQKIPLIIIIILLEWFLLWLTAAKGLVNLLSEYDPNYAQARLIDIRKGEAYFAYAAYENKIMCGKKKTLDDKGMVSYIPLESIFNGDCCLRNCESEPLICKNAKSLIKSSAIIIDVSKSSSFQSEYPAGAKLIPKLGGNEKIDEWDKGKSGREIAEELLSKEGINYNVNTNILIYCKEEIRTEIAAWRLIGLGYSNVYLCGSGCGLKMENEDI